MKLFILSVALLLAPARAYLKGERITTILDDLLKDYDARVRPNSGGAPTMVTMSAHASRVGGFCGKNDDMRVDMYFKQSWNDPRLVFPLKSGEKSEKIRLSHNFDMSKIWTPDTFFSNGRKGEKMSLLNGNHLFQIEPNGDVILIERVQTQARCGDGSKAWQVGQSRTCAIDVESYGFDNTVIDYKWKEAKKFRVEQTLYPYNVTSVSTSRQVISLSSGNYSQIAINFEIVKLGEKIATLPENDG